MANDDLTLQISGQASRGTQFLPGSKQARHAVARRKWYEKNKADQRVKALARYHANPERNRAKQRAYKLRHKERLAKQDREKAKLKRAKNPDEIRRIDREAYARNKRVRLIKGIRQRALKNGIPFDLVAHEMEWPTHCPVFGVELNYTAGFPPPDNAVSVDRIIPENGYVKGNVQVISWLANRMKSNASRNQILAFAKWAVETYG